jgi:hypothetical protein
MDLNVSSGWWDKFGRSPLILLISAAVRFAYLNFGIRFFFLLMDEESESELEISSGEESDELLSEDEGDGLLSFFFLAFLDARKKREFTLKFFQFS